MRKLLLVFSLSLNFVNAQKVILDKNIDKDNKPLFEVYSPEKDIFLIGYGNSIGGLVAGNKIKNISFFDRKSGTESNFMSDKNFYSSIFSSDKKSFITSDISNGILRAKAKFISLEGKEILIEKKALDGIQVMSFFGGNKIAFDNSIIYNLTNKKGELNIDLNKDKLIKLNFFDINSLTKSTIDLDPLNIDRLKGENNIKSKAKLGVTFELINNDSFSLITKSISKDFKNMTLYKTIYSNNGKIIDEKSFSVDLKNYHLLYSRNNGGETTIGGYDNKFTHFDDDNSINNHFVDKYTGDIYVYGLFGEDVSPLNTQGNPKGYYVFKFDKNGKKIWESINKINNSDFNKDHAMVTVYTNLFSLGNNVCFSIQINGLKDYFMYSLLASSSGNISKFQELDFGQTFAHLENVPFNEFKINSEFKDDKNFKNKDFNLNSIIAINNDKRIFEYIKNRNTESSISFYTHFSEKFTWIYEVDKDSYRIVLFE